MSYATTDDVADRLGRSLSDAETSQAEALLNDAEVMLTARISDLDARVSDDDTTHDLVVMIEANAVRRVLINPSGYRQMTESVDDYSTSGTYDSTRSTGELYVSDSEWGLLLDLQAAGSLRMWNGYCA